MPIILPIVVLQRMAFGFICARKLRLSEVKPAARDRWGKWRQNPV